MTIWYQSSGKIFDKYLLDALSESSAGDCLHIPQDIFDDKFRLYLSSERSPLSIVLDVGCASSIRSISASLKKSGRCSTLAALRLIILSDFSTWGAKSYTESINSFDVEFKSRKPLMCAQDQFSLENNITSLAPRYGVNVCVVGYGIFYGGAGMELSNIFRYRKLHRRGS